MKKAILLLALVAISAFIFAQNASSQPSPKEKGLKKDSLSKPPVVKPEFKLDPAKTYTIVLNLTTDQVGIITIDPAKWKEKVSHNPQINGGQIENIENVNEDIRKQIADQLSNQIRADYKKFVADTTAKPIPKSKFCNPK